MIVKQIRALAIKIPDRYTCMVENTHEETHRLIAKQILVRDASKIAFQCFVNLWFCFGVGNILIYFS